jgi:hypothetical protein
MRKSEMAEEKHGSHTYGTPATEKQLPPATEGLRGEGNPTAIDPPAEQERAIITAEGHKIIVAEDSGSAFAESKGAASKDGDK